MKYAAAYKKEFKLQEISVDDICVKHDNLLTKLQRDYFASLIKDTLYNHEYIIFDISKTCSDAFNIGSCFTLSLDNRFLGSCQEFLTTQINGYNQKYVMIVTDVVLGISCANIQGFSITYEEYNSLSRKLYIDIGLDAL